MRIMLWLVLLPVWVGAHEAGISQLSLCERAESLVVTWEVGRDDLDPITRNPTLVRDDERLRPDEARPTSDDGVQFTWNLQGGAISPMLRLEALKDARFGHRVLVTGCSGEAVAVLSALDPTFSSSSVPTRSGSTALLEGFWHVLSGWDHLLFLTVLVLGARSLGAGAVEVTLFAVAHSASLAATSAGLLTVPSTIVEPAIAGSIVVAAWVTARGQRDRYRGAMAFGFGLLHGMGFGSYWAEWSGAFGKSLVAFNLGVEAGQLVALLAMYPAIAGLRRRRNEPQLRLVASSFAAVIAGIWVVQRVAPVG